MAQVDGSGWTLRPGAQSCYVRHFFFNKTATRRLRFEDLSPPLNDEGMQAMWTRLLCLLAFACSEL